MDKITLIAEDFNRLDIPCGDNANSQFDNEKNCPIAKSLKRINFSFGSVTINYVWDGYANKILKINGDYSEIERCRLELLGGATEAYIEIIN